jgi:hypothetical protein
MKSILTNIAVFISLGYCFSQNVPQGFNFQAVARDGSNEVITNKEIKVEIAIISENIIVYREVHDATTSTTGVFNVIIGQGTTTDVFSSLNWGERTYRIRTRIDFNDGVGWQLAGESALLTVPYAMYALEAANGGSPGPPNILTIGSVVAGQTASATITGTSPQQTLNLVLPRGEKGDIGEPGSASSLTIGTVVSGQTASANITGTPPQQTLNLTLPKGDKGDKGDQGERGLKGDTGDPGPSNSLTIGTVVSGTAASASITGTPPNQILNLTLPKGDKGDPGDSGSGFSGSGTLGFIPRFSGSSSVSNSGIFQSTSGNLGIGTTSPEYLLDVRGTIRSNSLSELSSTNGLGTVTTFSPNGSMNARLSALVSNSNSGALVLGDTSGVAKYFGFVNPGGSGQLSLFGENNSANVIVSGTPGFPNCGFISIADTLGSTRIAAYVVNSNPFFEIRNTSGNTRAGFRINSNNQGEVFADLITMNFQDPDDNTKNICYSTLEGPEAAAYERGSAEIKNGEAYVPFSDHFKKIVNPNTVTILLTPYSIETYGLAVVEKSKDGFIVKELMHGKGNFKFDWEVKGVRKGHEEFKVVRDYEDSNNQKAPHSNESYNTGKMVVPIE